MANCSCSASPPLRLPSGRSSATPASTHLLHALREFEQFYNGHRPHQGIANARPLHPLPSPVPDQTQITGHSIQRYPRLGGVLNEYKNAA
jgi:hypothetical protein